MKQIQLTRGFVALVDDDDFDRVNRHKWNCLNHGAAQARIGNTRVQMHRFILGLNGNDKAAVVDHINHNRLDNRRCNLRIVTQSQNLANQVPSRNKNGQYKGVHDGLRGRDPLVGDVKYGRACIPMKRYRAVITKDHITYDLGGFPTEEMAARAYDQKAKEFYGEFALLNFPEAATAQA